MPKVDFFIKEGDSNPVLEVTAVDEDKVVIPLTAALTAKFFMYDPRTGAPKINGAAASITDAANGVMQFAWANDGSDTEDPGDYDAEFEIAWSDGTETTFPNFRFLRIKIARSIDTGD